jgi:hypothetical protein
MGHFYCEEVDAAVLPVACIFSPLLKNENKLIKLPVCLSVCPPLITSEPLGRI